MNNKNDSLLTKSPCRSLGWLSLAGAWVACCVGCYQESTIRQYTVPKEPSSTVAGSKIPSTSPREILAAIVPKQDDAWFFKLMGDPEKIQRYEKEFRQLVQTISFAEDGKPKWQLPDKWSEEGASQFVYASLRPPGEESLKITVSPLSMPSPVDQLDNAAWQKYVLLNVNRWRGQLQLSDQTWEEMARGLEPIENLSMKQAPAYFVSLRGKAAAGGGAAMNGAPINGGDATSPASVGPSSSAAGLPPGSVGRTPPKDIEFSLPAGWREVPPLSIIALKSFEADGPDGTKATITLTSASGDSESNVARWNSQVRGDPEQAPKALDQAERFVVNGASTEVVLLEGPAPDGQAIMAAMIQWNSQSTLFVKLMGPISAVKSQRDAFVALTKSLKW